MPSINRVIFAAAGARKTQTIIDAALANDSQRVLITSYTIDNLAQIERRLIKECGLVPPHITLISWFSFILRDLVKPYQNYLTETNRVRSLNFVSKPQKYASKQNVEGYYVDTASNIYSDNLADFAHSISEASGNLGVNRLEQIYDRIYIDEIQDLVGYDLELIDLLFGSGIDLTLVGDPRQSTYVTSRTRKNKSYQRLALYTWFEERERRGQCIIERRNESFRCNQEICDFADKLFPDLDATTSKNTDTTGHDGVFTIPKAEALAYAETHRPVVLRYSRSVDTLGLPAINFGASKGNTYPRVLIFTTRPIRKYLKSGNVADAGDVSKFYVAVTRAQHSVALVI